MSLLIELWKVIVYKGDNWTLQRNINSELRRITQHDYVEYVKNKPISTKEVEHSDISSINHSDLFMVRFTKDNKRQVVDCGVDGNLEMYSYDVYWEERGDDSVTIVRDTERTGSLVNYSLDHNYDCLITQCVYTDRFRINSIDECPIKFNSMKVLNWLLQEKSILVIESLMYYMVEQHDIKKTKTHRLPRNSVTIVKDLERTLQEIKKYYQDFLMTLLK